MREHAVFSEFAAFSRVSSFCHKQDNEHTGLNGVEGQMQTSMASTEETH